METLREFQDGAPAGTEEAILKLVAQQQLLPGPTDSVSRTRVLDYLEALNACLEVLKAWQPFPSIQLSTVVKECESRLETVCSCFFFFFFFVFFFFFFLKKKKFFVFFYFFLFSLLGF